MSEEKPLISVIITTYNRADLIGQAIQSVLDQTYDHIEIIIVDDGSTDDTAEVVESFNSPKIQYVWTENWGGPARPRNIGIRKARGECIAFLDADDYWKKEKLEVQLRHFESPDIVGVGADSIKVGDLQFHSNRPQCEDLILDFNGLLKRQTAALSSLVFKNIGFQFDESESFKFVEDFDFQLGITLKTGSKIRLLAEPLIFYRIHQGNNAAELTKGENIFYVYEKYGSHIDDADLREFRARAYFNLGIKALRINSPEGTVYFKKASFCQKGWNSCLSRLVGCFCLLPKPIKANCLSFYYKVLNSLEKMNGLPLQSLFYNPREILKK